MPAKPRDLVSVTEICRVTGYTPRRIQQFAAEGAIPKAGNGRYHLPGSVQGILRTLKTSRTVTTEARRILEAKARALELRNAQTEHRLIEIDEVAAGVGEIMSALRQEFNGIAAASTRDLAVRQAIDTHVNGAIERARQRFEAFEFDLKTGRDPLAADGED